MKNHVFIFLVLALAAVFPYREVGHGRFGLFSFEGEAEARGWLPSLHRGFVNTTPTLIQKNGIDYYLTTGGETKNVGIPAPTKVGDTVFVVIWTYTGGVFTGCSDDATPPNTYTTDNSYPTNVIMWICSGYQAHAATNVFATNANFGNDRFSYAVMEFSNIKNTSPADQVASGFDNGGGANSGNVTTGQKELLISSIKCNSIDPPEVPPGAPWTLQEELSSTFISQLVTSVQDAGTDLDARWEQGPNPDMEDPETCFGIITTYKLP